jgi:hypothetical protein
VFEFLVDSISAEGLVLGRNGDRDIPVGTRFTAVRRCRVHKEAGGYRTEELGVVGPVSLTLREVHWYSGTIDHVPGGHTAGLGVAGEGLAALAGWLADLPPHDYLWLVAAGSQDAERGAAPDRGDMY